MRITTIRYGKLVNLGDYNNERFEATAEREEGESPEAAASQLAAYVDTMLAVRAAEREALAEHEARERRIAYTRSEIARYTRELALLEAKPKDRRQGYEIERVDFLKPEIERLRQVLANPDVKSDQGDDYDEDEEDR